MKLKLLIATGLVTSALIATPATAADLNSAHALAQDYLEHSPNVEKVTNPEPKLMTVTCYTESGKRTATGSTRQSGVAAARVEDLGAVALVYKVDEDGGVGDYIGQWEILDVGYGASTGQGESDILPGKSEGDIESGECIDFRHPTYSECVRFMKLTQTGEGRSGSQVYVEIVWGKG